VRPLGEGEMNAELTFLSGKYVNVVNMHTGQRKGIDAAIDIFVKSELCSSTLILYSFLRRSMAACSTETLSLVWLFEPTPAYSLIRAIDDVRLVAYCLRTQTFDVIDTRNVGARSSYVLSGVGNVVNVLPLHQRMCCGVAGLH
jgi:hypothetical protein